MDGWLVLNQLSYFFLPAVEEVGTFYVLGS